MQLLPRVCFCFLAVSGLTFGDQSGSPVIVNEDDDALLTCSLDNVNIKPMLFDWRKDKKRLQVFMYDNGVLQDKGPPTQDEQFNGRVSHFPEELKHGNASIIIRKTKVTDSGSYTCEFPRLQPEKIFRIELIVVPILKDRTGEKIPGVSPKPYVTILEEKGLLQCDVPGASPKPTVEWWDSDNKKLNSKTLQDNEIKHLFNITIQATAVKPGYYHCVATQMDIGHQISSKIYVHEGAASGNVVIRATVASVVFGIIGIVVVV